MHPHFLRNGFSCIRTFRGTASHASVLREWFPQASVLFEERFFRHPYFLRNGFSGIRTFRGTASHASVFSRNGFLASALWVKRFLFAVTLFRGTDFFRHPVISKYFTVRVRYRKIEESCRSIPLRD